MIKSTPTRYTRLVNDNRVIGGRINKPSLNWATIHVRSKREGGRGYDAIDSLKEQGILARKAPTWCGSTSCYEGHVGIEVPHADKDRAWDFLYGKPAPHDCECLCHACEHARIDRSGE